jgi:hypothetical protein
LGADVPTLAFSAILLAAGPWVQITSTGHLAAHAATIEKGMNQIWLSVLLVIAVTYAVRVICRCDAWRPELGRNRAMNLVT